MNCQNKLEMQLEEVQTLALCDFDINKVPKPIRKYLLSNEEVLQERWDICNDCRDKKDKQTKKSRSNYYNANKKHYRKLHIKYKADLTESYVANMLADGTSLKAKDLPKVMVEVKRQTVQLKRVIRERKDDR